MHAGAATSNGTVSSSSSNNSLDELTGNEAAALDGKDTRGDGVHGASSPNSMSSSSSLSPNNSLDEQTGNEAAAILLMIWSSRLLGFKFMSSSF